MSNESYIFPLSVLFEELMNFPWKPSAQRFTLIMNPNAFSFMADRYYDMEGLSDNIMAWIYMDSQNSLDLGSYPVSNGYIDKLTIP